jgi:hypothetical protein
MSLQKIDPITGLPIHSDVPFTGALTGAPEIKVPSDKEFSPEINLLKQTVSDVTAKFNLSQKELKDLTEKYEALSQKYTDLLNQNSILQTAIPTPEKPVVHPPVGTDVTFVNHAGVHEAAKIIGHGLRGVNLAIQGKHPNDKYKRQEIPAGDPTKPLTYFTNS